MTKSTGKMVVRSRNNKTIMVDDQILRWRKYRKHKMAKKEKKQEVTPEKPIRNIFE